jgi:hypothetical protein
MQAIWAQSTDHVAPFLVPGQSQNTHNLGPVTLLLLRQQGKKTCSSPPTSGWAYRLPILATPA